MSTTPNKPTFGASSELRLLKTKITKRQSCECGPTKVWGFEQVKKKKRKVKVTFYFGILKMLFRLSQEQQYGGSQRERGLGRGWRRWRVSNMWRQKKPTRCVVSTGGIYRRCVIKWHTRNLHTVINQCFSNKLIFFKKKIHTKQIIKK